MWRAIASALTIAALSAGCNGCGPRRAGAGPDAGQATTAPSPVQWASWPMPNAVGQGLPNEQSYAVTGTGADEVVQDRVTGLSWRRAPGPQGVTQADARAECEQLTLAGQSDWRLPSRIELVSLLDLARTEPALDLTAFAGAPSNWYWTASPFAGEANKAWYVYFYFGYPDVEDESSPFGVRCVRGPQPATADAGARYQVGAEVVRDLGTGLAWQRAAPAVSFTFADAQSHCASLALDVQTGWRVPTMKELQTLVDETRVSPAIDTAAFPATPSEGFWSSSSWSGTPDLAWYVRFDRGDALYDLADVGRRVRCVR